MDDFGFMITRHVNSHETNKYWKICIKNIKRFYPLKKIIIIDDNSNPNFLDVNNDLSLNNDLNLNNVEIIYSDFRGRGEILPYYYLFKNKYFKNAIIIHDSVFFHNRIRFESIIERKIPIMPFWHFNLDNDNYLNSVRIASYLNNNIFITQKLFKNDDLLCLNHNKSYGCFGVQSFINVDFLCKINEKYNLFNLINIIKNREDRCCFERIFGIIIFNEYKNLYKIKSLFGNIFVHQKWGYNYKNYMYDLQKNKINKSIIKVWTGR